jgi:hypothetical protein
VPKINLIKKKIKDDDDTIQYYAGGSAPSSPVVGDIWMNTGEGKFYVYDGTDWQLEEVEDIDFADFDSLEAAYDRAMGVL